MEYRYLGRTGLKVASLCMGCMTFEPGQVEEKIAFRMLDRYVEAGGNFFDMADNYPGVEEKFGRWLHTRADRDQFVIGTKVRFPIGDGPNDVGLTRKHLLDSVDRTLKTLGTDYIDLYQAHCWDFVTPIEETLRTLNDLVTAGKTRYIGCSNFAGWHVMKALAVSEANGWAKFASVQTQYSLLVRSPEWEILPVCREHGVSATCWSPLAAGWLSGKYRREGVPPEGSRMARIARNKEEWDAVLRGGINNQIPHPSRVLEEEGFALEEKRLETERKWRVIEAVGDVAKVHGKTNAQVALAWLLAQPGVCAPVMGVSTVEQLDENLDSVGLRLSQGELSWLNQVSDPGLPYPQDFFERYGKPWR